MKNGIPICLGYFAVSFAFGIQAADINLSPFQAGLLSLLNVTSAGQFAGLAVIASAGSYIEMAILQAIVNLRYLLMSAALSQKLTPETPTFHRLGIAYGVTDEPQVSSQDMNVKEITEKTTVKKSSRSKSRSRSSSAKRITVRSGQTLGEIARRNHTTVAKLRSLNGIRGSNIRAGQKLRVR